MPGPVRRSAAALTALAAALGLATASTTLGGAPAAAADRAPQQLYLVTLGGPGTAGYDGALPALLRRLELRHEQDELLAEVGAPDPVYRWTTALNGFAVRLSASQAERLGTDPRTALVERNQVRPMAGDPGPAGALHAGSRARGGAGTVIGLVDSGIWPDSPLFADVPGLGRSAAGFHGACQDGEDWDARTCNRKLVGARWFVDGFGADRVRSTSSLSPRDDAGHGSEMASIAAGNSGVSVQVGDQRLGHYGGVAPQARLAVYKACWTAPDPDDDGCATADLVTAVDRATEDGVDVLALAVGGPPRFDALERALLGAAEADTVVVTAAGSARRGDVAAHPGPWVTTVGATTDVVRRGRIALPGSGSVTGAMASTQGVGPARVVLGADVAAPGASQAQARVCAPGSLDAGLAGGAIVWCERGDVGRVVKSDAVASADGVGMILANPGPGAVYADLHSVPTVHLEHDAAHTVRRWVAAHPHGRLALRPQGAQRPPARVPAWSAGGDPAGAVLKPDLVAPGVGLLGAVPPGIRGTRWDFLSGTSAATAYAAGAAATLRGAHDWHADVVRSVLATTARPVPAGTSVLRQGAGRVRPAGAGDPAGPGVAFEARPGGYRDWLAGRVPGGRLNTPSVLLSGHASVARRTVTNISGRAAWFTPRVGGFDRHSVVVSPASVRLAPGESARFTLRVGRTSQVQPLDDGWVTWRGSNGTRARIPVLVSR